MGFEQNLTSEVIMAHDAIPNFISVKYTSSCPGGEKPSDRGKCDNVNIGQEVSAHNLKTDRSLTQVQMQILIYHFNKCSNAQLYTVLITLLLP